MADTPKHLGFVRRQGWQPVEAREQPGATRRGKRRSTTRAAPTRFKWGHAQRKVRAVLVLEALLQSVADVVVQHLHERLARDGMRHGGGLRHPREVHVEQYQRRLQRSLMAHVARPRETQGASLASIWHVPGMLCVVRAAEKHAAERQ